MREALQWIASRDTGMSSKAIWAHMMGVQPEWGWSYPLDPDDFGRCHRLLWRVPGWRRRIGEMAEHGAVWAQLAAAWDELEALWLEESPSGRAPRLYDRMKELERAGRSAAASPSFDRPHPDTETRA